MTIVKRGSKFRVVSGTGKNLGESPTKAGAAKRLGEVEWFKHHSKCIVDPSLIKGNEGMQQYVPVIFSVAKPKDKEAQKLDFPSTTKQLELRDVKQPEFPSTPFTGEAYAQSFHNPRPSNTIKDGTHVIVQGDTPAAQGAGPFRGEHGPDTQFKGSDYVPDSVKQKARAANARKSIMIAGKRVIIRKGHETNETTDPKPRQSKRFLGEAEHMERHGKPGDEKKFYSRHSAEAAGQKKQIQMFERRFNPKKKVDTLDNLSRDESTLHNFSKKSIHKGSEGSDNSLLRDYPIDRGESGREFNADNERQARKDFTSAQKMKEKTKAYEDAKRAYVPGNGPFQLAMDAETAYLGRSAESDLEKGAIKVLGTAIKQTVKDELDPKKRKAENAKIKALTSTVRKAFGKFFDDKDSMKILTNKEIKAKQKADKKIESPKPVTRKIREIKVVDKSKGIMRLILQYTQNQPLAAGFKPLLAHLVTCEDDEEENLKGPKAVAAKAMSTGDIAEKVSKFPSKGPSSKARIRLMERAAEQKSDNSDDDVGPHPDFGPSGGYKGDTSKLGKGAFKDKWIKQQEDKGKDPLDPPSAAEVPPEAVRVDQKAGDAHEEALHRRRWGLKKKSSRPNPIKGGEGDDLEYDDVDEKELEEGVKVEQEHVKNSDDDEDKKKVKAADIAMDHLAEDDKYYTKLAEMERSGKEGDKAETKKKKLLKLGSATKSTKVVNLADYKKKKLEEKKGDYPRPFSVTRAEAERKKENND